MTIPVGPPGLRYAAGYLSSAEQHALLAAIRDVLREAPLFTPRMPRTGEPFSVRMSNCGPLGWVSDETGYRYQPMHPATGRSWPPIPDLVLKAWRELSEYALPPEACLINFYAPTARMGLHQDRDEQDLAAPVSRSPSATPVCSASEAAAATIRRARFALPPAMRSCWAAKAG